MRHYRSLELEVKPEFWTAARARGPEVGGKLSKPPGWTKLS